MSCFCAIFLYVTNQWHNMSIKTAIILNLFLPLRNIINNNYAVTLVSFVTHCFTVSLSGLKTSILDCCNCLVFFRKRKTTFSKRLQTISFLVLFWKYSPCKKYKESQCVCIMKEKCDCQITALVKILQNVDFFWNLEMSSRNSWWWETWYKGCSELGFDMAIGRQTCLYPLMSYLPCWHLYTVTSSPEVPSLFWDVIY